MKKKIENIIVSYVRYNERKNYSTYIQDRDIPTAIFHLQPTGYIALVKTRVYINATLHYNI